MENDARVSLDLISAKALLAYKGANKQMKERQMMEEAYGYNPYEREDRHKFTIYRVGSGPDRPPVRIGIATTLRRARAKAKDYLLDLYDNKLPTKMSSDMDNWVTIRRFGKDLENIFPGHGRKYPFINVSDFPERSKKFPDKDFLIRH